jgi:hypothetical protein
MLTAGCEPGHCYGPDPAATGDRLSMRGRAEGGGRTFSDFGLRLWVSPQTAEVGHGVLPRPAEHLFEIPNENGTESGMFLERDRAAFYQVRVSSITHPDGRLQFLPES